MPNPAWVPGVSGNPKGRPKSGEALTDLLREYGDIKDVTSGKRKIARKKALADILWRKALDGNLGIAEYIFDRLDGKPTVRQEVEHGGSIDFYADLTPEERKERIAELGKKFAAND